jgi:hypothetical protein
MTRTALAFALSAFFALPASAQDAEPVLGATTAAPAASADAVGPTAIAVGRLTAANRYTSATYGVGGVGLRNRSEGGIEVSGVTGATKAAFLYWAVITLGAPPAAVTSVRLSRLYPTPLAGAIITGTAIGSGPQPCWLGDRITVYKGTVPNGLANGNGFYRVQLNAGASGNTAGGDPWVAPFTLPLMEGASLVIVGTGTGRVAIYDRGLAGTTFSGANGSPSLTYSLVLPAVSATTVQWDNIGADGQKGTSRTDVRAVSNEFTRINGILIAGPGSPATDSDWNGGVAGPLPQLWDNTGHRFTLRAGVAALNVAMTAASDCLTPVANVVSY